MKINNQITNSGIINFSYSTLYKIGAYAALIAAILFRRNLDAEWSLLHSIGLLNIEPVIAPDTVNGWYMLFQQNRLIGLLLLNAFDLINYALLGFIFLALYAALRKLSASWMLIVLALAFTGITVYFATNQSFTMLSLSKQYNAATNETQRAIILAAGQAVLVIHCNAGFSGSGITLSYLMVTIAGLITSFIMLQSNIFPKSAAYMGILANGFGLGYYIVLIIAPTLVFIPLSISAIFLLIWYLQIGNRLWALGSHKTIEQIQVAHACNSNGSQKDIFPLPL